MSTALLNVVWIQESKNRPDGVDAFKQWVKQQTCAAVLEGIIWNKAGGIAFPLSDPLRKCQAANVNALLDALACRYVCIAGEDLLQQNETYFEENLFALEHGALAFTVNLRGQPDWAMQYLRNGWLPGNSGTPLLRQVVRRDCLKGELTLDLSQWIRMRKGFPSVAGRIVCHTTNNVDSPGSIPFESPILIEGAEATVEGTDILLRARKEWEWKTPFSGMRPIVSVLSDVELASPLPTVIMIHTYLAVGGAEKLHLNIIRELKNQVRFIVLGIDPLDRSLGTTADEFRELTPFVYTIPDFIYPSMYWAFLKSGIE
jgi:hypothetical protein